ncbi:class I SAM-dependent methyltransferase [Nocardioides jensenii]|uniref:class I SAM-dependent methyltransferase n=1 Tax=Nocardioides jensenii TaxID=1843 RepID=UPI001C3F3456|nr:class I SAM-dependent methyltransferase [Nocardioides jensenii]
MSLLLRLLRVADWLLVIPLVPAAALLKLVRRAGLHRLPMAHATLRRVGVLPVRNHYYEPWVERAMLERPLDEERPLPGINLNESGQVDFIRSLKYADELLDLEDPPGTPLGYQFGNRMFEQGDAELLYSVIRAGRPARIYEIGSGHSTLVARKAIVANQREDDGYSCEHLCVEPYEADWLERTGIRIVRERAEKLGAEFFAALDEGDLLFIDSSHIIRPQGDVLFEFLELLPSLRQGVTVHVHDIFTPRDYPEEWVIDVQRLWNEQYLLEAFLSHNHDWSIVAAANHLRHHHFGDFQAACPNLREEHEPGSIYLRRVSA